MKTLSVFPEKVFSIGPVQVTDTVITTWFVMARRNSDLCSLYKEAVHTTIYRSGDPGGYF